MPDYQTFVKKLSEKQIGGAYDDADDGGDEEGEGSVSDAYFTLANEKEVRYNLSASSAVYTSESKSVVVRQDQNIENSTGGIIWETSYILALWLEAKEKGEAATAAVKSEPLPLKRVLELGSGAGMLGLILSRMTSVKSVALSDCHEVMDLLKGNATRNDFKNVSVQLLRWDQCEDDIQAAAGSLEKNSFDLIVATDVVFCVELVEPLLNTRAVLLKDKDDSDDENSSDGGNGGGGVCYVCMQVRCEDAFNFFVKQSEELFIVENLTSDLEAVVPHSATMQVHLFALRKKKTKKDKKKKRSKEEKKHEKKKKKQRKSAEDEE
jgi:hypothetical protein